MFTGRRFFPKEKQRKQTFNYILFPKGSNIPSNEKDKGVGWDGRHKKNAPKDKQKIATIPPPQNHPTGLEASPHNT